MTVCGWVGGKGGEAIERQQEWNNAIMYRGLKEWVGWGVERDGAKAKHSCTH